MSASDDTAKLIATLREFLAEDGWAPGSVAMNRLGDLQNLMERHDAALREARPYVYNVFREHHDWRGETAAEVLARVDAALAGSGDT